MVLFWGVAELRIIVDGVCLGPPHSWKLLFGNRLEELMHEHHVLSWKVPSL